MKSGPEGWRDGQQSLVRIDLELSHSSTPLPALFLLSNSKPLTRTNFLTFLTRLRDYFHMHCICQVESKFCTEVSSYVASLSLHASSQQKAKATESLSRLVYLEPLLWPQAPSLTNSHGFPHKGSKRFSNSNLIKILTDIDPNTNTYAKDEKTFRQ